MNHGNKIKKEILNLVAKDQEIIVFDTETTGLQTMSDQIIQFSALKGRFKEVNGVFKFIETNRIDEYIRPARPLPEIITKITGITDAMLADKPLEHEIFPKIKDFMGSDSYISGYNVNFDIGMLSSLYERQGNTFTFNSSFDVLKMARELVSKKDLIDANLEPSYKQENIAKLYDLAEGIQFHSAIDDTVVCSNLFAAFINDYKAEPDDGPKYRLKIRKVYQETNFQHDRNGLWVIGDICNVYYSYKYHRWCCSSNNEEKIQAFESIDLDNLTEDVLKLTGLNSEDDFKKFNSSQETKMRKAKRVYNFAFWAKHNLRRVYFVVSDEEKTEKCFYDLDKGTFYCPGFEKDSVEKKAKKKIDEMCIS